MRLGVANAVGGYIPKLATGETFERTAFVSATGNDGTAVINDPNLPWALFATALTYLETNYSGQTVTVRVINNPAESFTVSAGLSGLLTIKNYGAWTALTGNITANGADGSSVGDSGEAGRSITIDGVQITGDFAGNGGNGAQGTSSASTGGTGGAGGVGATLTMLNGATVTNSSQNGGAGGAGGDVSDTDAFGGTGGDGGNGGNTTLLGGSSITSTHSYTGGAGGAGGASPFGTPGGAGNAGASGDVS